MSGIPACYVVNYDEQFCITYVSDFFAFCTSVSANHYPENVVWEKLYCGVWQGL